MTESLRDIRLFVAAYEERSFTAAASREHATQSGVSQHIRKLEERFGVKLFFRSKRRVSPTPAADAYYNRCVEILRLNEATNQSMMLYGHGVSGDIAVGLMPTMTRVSLAPAMRRFIASYPNVAIRVVEAYSPILTQAVLTGELDFAIVPAIPGRPGLKTQHFMTTYETLVTRLDERSADAHLRPIRLDTLGAMKMVLPSQANTRRMSIETYFASNGVKIERMLEMDAMMGTIDFVANSNWATILPAIMLSATDEPLPLAIRPIVEPLLRLDLVLIEPSRHVISPPAAAFLALLREEASRINQSWSASFVEARATEV